MKRYAQRQQTLGLKDFTEVEAELAVFAGRRAWVTGDGPKAIFADAVGWLRERDVLLPGVSRLARLVARERDAATQRLWETLHAALTGQQRLALDVGRISLPALTPGIGVGGEISRRPAAAAGLAIRTGTTRLDGNPRPSRSTTSSTSQRPSGSSRNPAAWLIAFSL